MVFFDDFGAFVSAGYYDLHLKIEEARYILFKSRDPFIA